MSLETPAQGDVEQANVRQYSAAGGVVIDGEKMLLLDRPLRQEVRLPKGHIDPGETPDVTALRETAEESGYNDLVIIADLGSQVVEFDHKDTHFIRTEYYFLMHLNSQRQATRPAQDSEQFRVLWTPIAQAVDLLTYSSEKAVAYKAIQVLAKLSVNQ